MPQFSYKVKDKSDQIISATVTAVSESDAVANLQAQGYKIISIKAKTSSQLAFGDLGSGVSIVDKANLCRYLSTMIGAGLPLSEAIETISRDTRSGVFKHILQDINYNLQQGEALSSTFTRYPRIFDPVFVAIIKAGEQSGSLQKSFQYLEEQLMSSHNLTQKVRGALMYPAVVISAMFGIGSILIVFVIPQIAQVFLRTKLPIPKLTVIILQVGLFLNKNLGLAIGFLGVLLVGLILVTRTYQGKKFFVNLLKRTPGVTSLFERLDLARFSRTLATLLESGVPITEAMNVATVTLSLPKFEHLAEALRSDIKKGESVASILRDHHQVVPDLMISMVSTGEKTGTTDKILLKLAIFYEQELESSVKNFTAILEPIIMLVIGLGVGGMVLSVITPIYGLVSTLQGAQR